MSNNQWPINRFKKFIGSVLLLPAAMAASKTSWAGDSMVESYYPETYEESRLAFVSNCAIIDQAVCHKYAIESKTDPGKLWIDTAFIPGQGYKLLVVESGIHGPESNAAAGAQLLLMDRHLSGLHKAGFDILLIHGVNPWGWKHGRIGDEDNVNLTRNFYVGKSIYSKINSDYELNLFQFEPQGKVSEISFDSFRLYIALIATVLGQFSDYATINSGFDQGQYAHPRGVNFGGYKHVQQTLILQDILTPVLQNDYDEILFVDFRTGWGAKNVLSVISGIEPPKDKFYQLKNKLAGINGIEFHTPNPTDPKHIHYDGDVIDYVPKLTPHEKSKFLAVTMDYGTIGNDTVAQLQKVSRIILENQAYWFGCENKEVCAKVRQDFLDIFNPADQNWRAAVLQQADEVFTAFEKN